jgi:ribonuclease HII
MVNPVCIQTKDTAIDTSLSSFIVGLVNALDDVSIVHDASRLPSESLVNMNRRAMGMEDFHPPLFVRRYKEKRNRWEGLVRNERSDPKSIVHDASRLPSESLLNMNRRALGMEDFHSPQFVRRDKEKRNRWEGLVRTERTGPKLTVQDPSSTHEAATSPGLGSIQCSSSMLLRPTRRLESPISPNEGQVGRNEATLKGLASSSKACVVHEEAMSPQTNRTAASKSLTRKDRRALTRNLKDSILPIPSRLKSPKIERRRVGSVQRQKSDSALVKPMPKDRVLPLLQTAIEELEAGDEIALVSIDSYAIESPTTFRWVVGEHLNDLSASSHSAPLPPPPLENDPDSPPLMNEGLGGRKASTLKRWSSSTMECMVNEEAMSPQTNRTAASKSLTRKDRRTLTRNLKDSMLPMPSRLKSPKIDKRKQSIQRYQSDSAIVKPRRVISLLSLQHQTTIEELEVADEIALVSIDSEEAKSSTRSQCGMVHLGEHLSDSSLSIPPPPENNLDAPLLPNEGLGGEKSASRKGTRKPRDSMLPMPSRLLSPKMERSKVVPLPSQFQAE